MDYHTQPMDWRVEAGHGGVQRLGLALRYNEYGSLLAREINVMDTTDTKQITLTTRARNGKVSVHADIAVSGEDRDYIVTIAVTPSSPEHAAVLPPKTLDELYGALADTPLPEITDHLMPV